MYSMKTIHTDIQRCETFVNKIVGEMLAQFLSHNFGGPMTFSKELEISFE